MPKPWSLSSRENNPKFAPEPTTRTPINIARLLEVYDDYPKLVADYQSLSAKFEQAEIDIDEGNRKYEDIEEQLSSEKTQRAEDATAAKKAQETAVTAKEEAVRKELNPKIEDLTAKLATMTTDRDKQKKELELLRKQAEGWISKMEKLHGDRVAAEEKERKAAEEHATLATSLRELDQEILEGLRVASKPPQNKRNSTISDGASVRSHKLTATDGHSIRREGSLRPPTTHDGASVRKEGSTKAGVSSDGASEKKEVKDSGRWKEWS